MENIGKITVQALGAALAYYLLGQLAIHLTIMPEGIVTFWPPNAVIVTALCLTPRKQWWIFLVAGIGAEFVADYGFFPLWQIAGFGLVNATEAALAASLIRWKLFENDDYQGINVRLALGLGGLFLFIAPPLAAFGGAGIYLIGDPTLSYWSFWQVWWFGDAIGLLVIAPFLLVWVGEKVPLSFKSQRGFVEFSVLIVIVVVFGAGVFLSPDTWHRWIDSPALLLPTIVWAAVRFGLHGTTAVTVLISFIVAAGTTQGSGPFFNAASQSETVLAVQEYLLIVVILSLSLGTAFRQIQWSMKELENEQLLLEDRVEERTRELEEARKLAERHALTDGLTNMHNRRAFFQYARIINDQAKRHGHIYSIVMMDIDNFKEINDTYGHAVGDKVLVGVAKTIINVSRASDIVGRIGGDEFVLCLPVTTLSETTTLSERLKKSIADLVTPFSDQEISITVSIGIADCCGKDCDIESTLGRADSALYDAKKGGRNKIATAT